MKFCQYVLFGGCKIISKFPVTFLVFKKSQILTTMTIFLCTLLGIMGAYILWKSWFNEPWSLNFELTFAICLDLFNFCQSSVSFTFYNNNLPILVMNLSGCFPSFLSNTPPTWTLLKDAVLSIYVDVSAWSVVGGHVSCVQKSIHDFFCRNDQENSFPRWTMKLPRNKLWHT